MVSTIFLVGYMGVGKTAVGKSLAKECKYNFYDLDNYIELKEKKTIDQIFKEKNEVYFRKIEHEYLKELSSLKENKIISTGGGTPCFDNNLNIINSTENSISIYLKASVEVLIERLRNGLIKRPLLSHLNDNDKLNEFIKKHLFERSFYYEQSKIKVKTDNMYLSDITKMIFEILT